MYIKIPVVPVSEGRNSELTAHSDTHQRDYQNTQLLSGECILAANIVFNYMPHPSTSKWHFQFFFYFNILDCKCEYMCHPHATGNKSLLREGYVGDNIYRNFQIQHHYVQIDIKPITGRWDFSNTKQYLPWIKMNYY